MSDATMVLRRFSDNHKWLNENFEKLQEYVGRYVAIDNGAVIGIGKTREELERRFSDRPGVYIELISPAKLVWLL